jgi:hypothetical protein
MHNGWRAEIFMQPVFKYLPLKPQQETAGGLRCWLVDLVGLGLFAGAMYLLYLLS